MSEALERSRRGLEAHRARFAELVAQVRNVQPHLTEEQIEDVLDALWVLGELK